MFILNYLNFPNSYFDCTKVHFSSKENVLMSDSLIFFRQNDYSGLCAPPKLPLPVPRRSKSQSAAASVDPSATGRIPQHHVPHNATCHEIAVCVCYPSILSKGSKSLQKRENCTQNRPHVVINHLIKLGGVCHDHSYSLILHGNICSWFVCVCKLHFL